MWTYSSTLVVCPSMADGASDTIIIRSHFEQIVTIETSIFTTVQRCLLFRCLLLSLRCLRPFERHTARFLEVRLVWAAGDHSGFSTMCTAACSRMCLFWNWRKIVRKQIGYTVGGRRWRGRRLLPR